MLGDSTEYAARALEAGAADVRLRLYPKMWHVWPMYEEACGQQGEGEGEGGTTGLKAATNALAEAAAFVRGVIG